MSGPFHLSASERRLLELSGIPPGLLALASYESLTIQLQPGDSVFFCTDGLTDASDTGDEQFGIERLHLLCMENRLAPQAEVLQRVFAALHRFAAGCEQQDDMAATLFHLSGPAPRLFPRSHVESGQGVFGCQLTVLSPSSNNHR